MRRYVFLYTILCLDNSSLSTRAIPVINLSISLLLNAAAINKDSSASDELKHNAFPFVTMTVTCLSTVEEF
jgi:hypothetical protein